MSTPQPVLPVLKFTYGIITVIYPLLPGLFHSEFGKSHLPLMDICDVFIFSLYMIYLRVRACMLSRFSHVQLFATLWTDAHLASLSMDSPGKSTGVGFHCLLQLRRVRTLQS